MKKTKFAVCITKKFPMLIQHKIYKVLADKVGEKAGHIRIVDESEEDYLYLMDDFLILELTKEQENALTQSYVEVASL